MQNKINWIKCLCCFKKLIMHFGSVQFEAQVQTHIFIIIIFSSSFLHFSKWAESYQVKSKRSIPLALLHGDFFNKFLGKAFCQWDVYNKTNICESLCFISLGATSLLCLLKCFSALCCCLCLLQYQLKKGSRQAVSIWHDQNNCDISYFASNFLKIQHNTVHLYCLSVEKFAFWFVIYIKTLNAVNNKISTAQWNTELKTAQYFSILFKYYY